MVTDIGFLSTGKYDDCFRSDSAIHALEWFQFQPNVTSDSHKEERVWPQSCK